MTNRTWMAACSAIVGFATAAMAQTAAPPQSPAASADRKITVTGCLAPAPASAAASPMTGTAGTSGTAGTAGTAGAVGTAGTAGTASTAATAGTAGETAAAAATFQLTNATAAPSESSANAAGATASDAANAAAAQTYRLIANPTALSPHVGKKLALTGTLEAQDSSAAATASAAGSEPKAPALRVESGKVIAESCAQQ